MSRSRGVKPSSTKKTVSQARNLRGSHNQASRRKQRHGKPRRDVRDWDIRNLRIETQMADSEVITRLGQGV